MADLVKIISFKMLRNFRTVLQEIEQREHLCVHENSLNLFQNNGIFAEIIPRCKIPC